MSSIGHIKAQKRAIVSEYAKPEDLRGFAQILNTLVPLVALCCLIRPAAGISWLLAAALIVPISLFLLRAFVLMHDCGHRSLFRTDRLNRAFGFLLGVISGMPQYVWSVNHRHHHMTNGNWERHRGALNILTVDEYQALTPRQRLKYRLERNLWMAPLGGFVYLIFNPRFTWFKGCLGLAIHVLRRKIALPRLSLRTIVAQFETPYWHSAKEFRHMSLNNLAVLGLWALMAWTLGPVLFFSVYLVSLSLAGGGGIALFAVQHNFEHSYAAGNRDWDYDTAAILGTSLLVLPRWLHWFTGNIAYHHVHHLSAKIPNYRLVECHDAYRDLFGEVRRVRLSEVPAALRCLLWDTEAGRIVSFAEASVGEAGLAEAGVTA